MITTPQIASSGLQCSSLYNNVMKLRFIDNKLAIIQGANTRMCICLKNLYIPVTQWNESITVLQPGEVRRVELGLSANFGNRREIYEYDLSPYSSEIILFQLSITCTSKQINEIISFSSGTSFIQTISNIRNAINNNTIIRNEIEVINENITEKTFQIRTISSGINFGYELSTIGSPVLIIQNSIIHTAKRYEYGRGKVIFVYPIYNESIQPPLSSNNKHIQYAYDDDYQENGNNATFRNMGKIYISTSDDDVEESDMNLIETIWIKNTHSTALQIQILVAS